MSLPDPPILAFVVTGVVLLVFGLAALLSSDWWPERSSKRFIARERARRAKEVGLSPNEDDDDLIATLEAQKRRIHELESQRDPDVLRSADKERTKRALRRARAKERYVDRKRKDEL